MASDTGSKKVLWHSAAPWVGSGYGNQTGLFTPRIRAAGFDVAMSATWGLMGDTLEWNGMPVYPADDRYGNATLGQLYDKVKADLLVVLLDAWVLKPEMLRGRNVACWTPVDHDPCPPKVTQFFRESGAQPVAMSKFGEQALRAEGLDPLYVPHAVDTGVFQYASNRDKLRHIANIPEDAFVVGMVANNAGHTPPRKAFPQAIQAFSAFRQTHPDALLYFHTEMTGLRGRGPHQGVNIPDLLERFEVPASAVKFTPQLELELGVPASWMNVLYNCFDVLLSPSYGEGFGIPIIEAQACGVPVIVNNWTAMPELCGAGWIVGGEPEWHSTPDGGGDSFFMAPFVGDIIRALEAAYEARGSEELASQARGFALQYDADRVMAEHWAPVLDRLFRPREVPPLRAGGANRAMRRAAAKAK